MPDIRFVTYGEHLNGDYGYGLVYYFPPRIDDTNWTLPSMSYMMVL